MPSALATSPNSTTSRRRSPRSYFETKDCGLLRRCDNSDCVKQADFRASIRSSRSALQASLSNVATRSQRVYDHALKIPNQVLLGAQRLGVSAVWCICTPLRVRYAKNLGRRAVSQERIIICTILKYIFFCVGGGSYTPI